ncbi:hypothetical protein B0H12DRAFT_1239717 [Mycena haematopus]|nr:hypothetical protein B0H12DRAFT_1239717 [Mycena haematopus]
MLHYHGTPSALPRLMLPCYQHPITAQTTSSRLLLCTLFLSAWFPGRLFATKLPRRYPSHRPSAHASPTTPLLMTPCLALCGSSDSLDPRRHHLQQTLAPCTALPRYHAAAPCRYSRYPRACLPHSTRSPAPPSVPATTSSTARPCTTTVPNAPCQNAALPCYSGIVSAPVHPPASNPIPATPSLMTRPSRTPRYQFPPSLHLPRASAPPQPPRPLKPLPGTSGIVSTPAHHHNSARPPMPLRNTALPPATPPLLLPIAPARPNSTRPPIPQYNTPGYSVNRPSPDSPSHHTQYYPPCFDYDFISFLSRLCTHNIAAPVIITTKPLNWTELQLYR